MTSGRSMTSIPRKASAATTSCWSHEYSSVKLCTEPPRAKYRSSVLTGIRVSAMQTCPLIFRGLDLMGSSLALIGNLLPFGDRRSSYTHCAVTGTPRRSLPRRLVDGIAPETLPLTGARAGRLMAAWFKLLFRRRRG